MKTLNFKDRLLSTKDVSELLNLSEATVKRYIYDGKLPSVKIGNARRLKVEDIQSFINNTATPQQPLPAGTNLKIIPGYMGIKTQIIDHIHLEINKIAKKGDVILDVFAGSGTVGYELKRDYTVYANDIEPYSCTINQLLIENFLTTREIGEFDISLLGAPYEKNKEALLNHSKINLAEYHKNYKKFPYTLFTEYFAGSYFGREQSIQIDSLRYAVDQVDEKYRSMLLSCLIFACYQTVASVGGHFAQPKISKESNQADIEKKRSLDVKSFFDRKLAEIKDRLYVDENKHRVFCLDFRQLLDLEEVKKAPVSVTYIDPPYTIDHYSRFYHVLNTLVLYDYPEKNGRGLYRSDRHQSRFCIKSTVYDELDALVYRLAQLRSKIVLSYSDSYRSLLKTEQILEILKKYYQPGSVKTPIKIEYHYSGFGQSASNKANELLFVATEPK